jgi:predicted O-linked N-acetylglucosamine transferase (SPINDLY family)
MPTIPGALKTALEHQEAGRLPEAEALYRQILQVQPQHADAAFSLGVVYQQRGQLIEATLQYQRALALRPAFAEAQNNLGTAFAAQGMPVEAVAHYRQALALKPDYAEAHYNLGNALKEEGQLDAAAAAYRQALALKPGFAEAHTNLGVVRQQQGQLPEAIAHYQRALKLNPAMAGVYFNLGLAYQTEGKLDEAVAAYQQSATLRPDHAETHNNLGNALSSQGKVEEAVDHFRKTLLLRPTFAGAHYNLGLAYQKQDKHQEAAAAYRQALTFKPDYWEAENQLMHQSQQLCAWSHLEEMFARQRDVIQTNPSARINPFNLLAIPISAAEQLRCARNWVANYLAPLAGLRERLGFTFSRTSRGRLRIGYLSADFHGHATNYVIAELFELHDRARLEVVAYSYGPDDDNAARQRIVRACDRFVDLRSACFEEAARRIHADGIDILVDLTGYTGSARTQVLALRPAPIQVNYLGYLGTMGAGFIDYIITDRFATPPDQSPYFTEQFVYLPDSFLPSDRKRRIASRTPARGEYGLPEDGFVFCCFNNTYKITPAVFEVWMRLLQALPDSVLWLLEANPWAAANLRREAAARGASPARLVFAPRVAMGEYLARYRLASLFLDTLPYNAGATASDALWAGLPLLTCAGETFASRVAGSLLTAIGLPELITDSLAEYETRALRLAQHPEELAALRERLAANRDTAPLFDTPRITRHLETAYQMMWERYLRGLPPGPIEVPPLEH